MKICIITGVFPARSNTFITDHAMGLAKRGHQVIVVSCGPESGISSRELKDVDQSIIRYNAQNLGSSQLAKTWLYLKVFFSDIAFIKQIAMRRPWNLRELIRARLLGKQFENIENCDRFHVHYGTIAGALHFSNLLPIDTIVTWHGYDANMVPTERGEEMYQNLFDGRYQHTVGSNFMAKRLIVLGVRKDSLKVIPMGVDLEKFFPKCRVSRQTGAVSMISVGRLDEMKGHEFLIRAVSDLIREGYRIQLQIIGEGPLRSSLERLVRCLEGQRFIKLAGSMTSEEIIEEMHRSDLFALTGTVAASGRVETQGVAIVEAQATGLPVIVSDVGGVPETIIDKETGFLCPTGDVAFIKTCIRFCIDNPNDARNLGEKGRQFVVKKFSLEKMLDSFEELYSI